MSENLRSSAYAQKHAALKKCIKEKVEQQALRDAENVQSFLMPFLAGPARMRLRRSMYTHLYVWGISDVDVTLNSSAYNSVKLEYHMSLVPLIEVDDNGDSKLREQVPCTGWENSNNGKTTVVDGCLVAANTSNKPLRVLSGSIDFDSSQSAECPKLQPAYDDILLMTLGPGQRIEATFQCIWARGCDVDTMKTLWEPTVGASFWMVDPRTRKPYFATPAAAVVISDDEFASDDDTGPEDTTRKKRKEDNDEHLEATGNCSLTTSSGPNETSDDEFASDNDFETEDVASIENLSLTISSPYRDVAVRTTGSPGNDRVHRIGWFTASTEYSRRRSRQQRRNGSEGENKTN